MFYPLLKTRLIQEVAQGVNLICCWEGECKGSPYGHRSSVQVTRLPLDQELDWDHFPEATPEQLAQLDKCERCGAPRPAGVRTSRGSSRLYNTDSGKPEPGDMFWADWYECKERGKCFYKWSNCDGRHLHVVLPNGSHWDVDSRASNCTKRDDTIHRCWVRHGEPPHTHVDKNGNTCAAGAGSIIAGDYHGFLIKGHLIDCSDPQYGQIVQRLNALPTP